MAASSNTGIAMHAVWCAPADADCMPQAKRRHRRNGEAARAMKVLGDAIEYLTEEFAGGDGSITEHKGQVDAVKLLMALNHHIYVEGSEVPTLRERIERFVGRFVQTA